MKRFQVVLSVVVCLFVFNPIEGTAQSSLDSLIQRADSLYKHYEGRAALQAYKEIVSKDSSFYRGWWRISIIYNRLGYRTKDSDKRRKYYLKSVEAARRAMEIHPYKAQSHFILGVALGRKAQIVGVRKRLALAEEIRNHARRALEIDSLHGGAHFLLGRWHLEITNLSIAERLAANWLFGGLPEGGSIQKALNHLKKAVEIKPDMIVYWVDLAKAYHRVGKLHKAKESLREALTIKAKSPAHEKYQKKARQLLEEWS